MNIKESKYIILFFAIVFALTAAVIFFSNGDNTSDDTVVIYVSVDQVFSEPILKKYEEKTGINVRAVYDVEATKTTGLVNRLIAEKNRPVADVFWNGEFSRTITLKDEGVLASYESPSGLDIPDQYHDPQGYWTGFGGRARVLMVNTELVQTYPDSLFDLLNETYQGDEIAIAYPMFGTSATHAAALYAVLGPDEGKQFYQDLADKGVRVVDGNSVVRDLVADGRASIGLTDTDDAYGALERGAPVKIIVPDQDENGIGTLIIPNTVALIAGAPHEDRGKQLIDYLLSREVEAELVDSGWFQASLRDVEVTKNKFNGTIKGMDANLNEVNAQQEDAMADLRDIFIR